MFVKKLFYLVFFSISNSFSARIALNKFIKLPDIDFLFTSQDAECCSISENAQQGSNDGGSGLLIFVSSDSNVFGNSAKNL